MGRLIAFYATCACVLAGCAAKGDPAAKTDSTAEAAVVAAPATPNAVTIHTKDFAFSAPSTLPAGMTTITLVNDGPSVHHVDLVRLDSGKTIKDLEKALALPAAPPDWAAAVGGPNAADSGKDATATVDLQPGNYAMLCFVEGADGVPHFAKGMISPLTVTAAPSGTPAPAPTPDVSLTLTDYAFTFTAPVTAGRRVIEVKNAGSQTHEAEVVRLAPGKTLQQLMGWIAKPQGPPPASFIGGAAPFRGAPTYITADFTPGNYALICFLPDTKDGKPHFAHGMTKAFTVM